MLKIFKSVFWSLGIMCLAILCIHFYQENQKPQGSLISPYLQSSKLKLAESVWFPKDVKAQAPDAPEITAKAAFFVETKSGEVLFEKKANEKLSIASLTKIMTSIVTLENRKMDEKLYISKRASEMEPDKMYLHHKEKITVRGLLEGIYLVSANDASEALAEGVTGKRSEFISLMNSKAKQLGMNNTYFINPSGLEEDGVFQHSTAYDVALMSRYAINKFPELVDISSKPHIYIEETETHRAYDLYSGINLLTTYPGVLGFKTGFTPEAGLTLVTLARRGDKEIVGVLLGCTNRRDDAKLMLDYSFSKLGL